MIDGRAERENGDWCSGQSIRSEPTVTPREIAVVLVVDIIGSTKLRSRIKEDDYGEVYDELRTVSRRIVGNHGGRVVKEQGDGLMAAFPTATGALSAGVGILQANTTANRRRPTRAKLGLRLGASAGELTWVDGDITGMAPVEATRLEAAARRNSLYCSDLVRALAGGQDRQRFVPVGPLVLSGLDGPVTTWRVSWRPASSSRELALPDTLRAESRLNFVGRTTEVALLAKAWDDARTGTGRMVAIRGEPGVGKTALCGEMARRCVGDGGIVLYGRADQKVAHTYQPFVEALTSYVRKVSQLELLAPEHAAELSRLVPEIRHRFPELPEPRKEDPDTQRYLLFEAIVAWLDLLAQEDPVVLIIDDATWATGPTLDMLGHIAGALPTRAILCVLTLRPQDATPALRDIITELYRRVDLATIELRGLDEHDVIDTLRDLLGDTPLHPAISALGSAVWRRTGGNPFFVGELFADLLASGSIQLDEVGWRATISAAELTIPSAIGDVVRQRARTLSEQARRLVEAAAVAGVVFDVTTVRHVAELDERQFADGLDEADAAGLVRSVGDGDRYEFTHAIVRDVLYDGQSPYRRSLVHQAIARAIEHLHATQCEEHAGELALHYSRSPGAVGAETAVWYAAVAAERSAKRLAHSEAAAHYRRALDCVRRAELRDAEKVRCGLLVELGIALHRAGDPGSRRTLLDGARLAAELGDGPLCARAVLAGSRGIFSSTGVVVGDRIDMLRAALELAGSADSPTRAVLLAELSVELSFVGDHVEQDALSDEATAMAHRLGAPGPLIRVLSLRLATLWRADRVAERLDIDAELDTRCAAYGRGQPMLFAATMGCQAAMEAGDFETADERLEVVDRIAEELRHPLTVGYARLRQSIRAAVDGRLADSERLADEAYELCRASGQPDARAFWVGQRFNIRFHQGRLDEVIDDLAAVADEYPGIVAFRAALGPRRDAARSDRVGTGLTRRRLRARRYRGAR